MTCILSPNGHVIRREYDKANRLTREIREDSRNNIRREFVYEYDRAGNLTAFINSTLNNLSSVTDQLGNTETFCYDMEGNLAEHIDRNGNRVILSFNMDRNLTMRRAYTKDNQESVCESFSYNPDGTLRTAISNGMAYSCSYTPNGWIKSKEASGRTLIRYDYDRNGRVKELRDISGKTTKYAYDPANRLKQVFDECGSQLVEYAYNPDNTVASKLYGNGILTSYAYDGDRNLTELKAVVSKGSTQSPPATVSVMWTVNPTNCIHGAIPVHRQ